MANFFKTDKIVETAGPGDYCQLCARQITGTRDEVYRQLTELKNNTEGQLVFKIKKRGDSICICKEHLKEAYDMLYPQPTNNQEVAKEEKEDGKKK